MVVELDDDTRIRHRYLDHDPGECRLQGTGALTGVVGTIALRSARSLGGDLRIFGPCARHPALLLVTDGKVEERADLGLQALAFGELVARFGEATLSHQPATGLEERFGENFVVLGWFVGTSR